MLRIVRLLVGSILVFVATGLWVIASTDVIPFEGIMVGVGFGIATGVVLSYLCMGDPA